MRELTHYRNGGLVFASGLSSFSHAHKDVSTVNFQAKGATPRTIYIKIPLDR